MIEDTSCYKTVGYWVKYVQKQTNQVYEARQGHDDINDDVNEHAYDR